MSITPLQVDLTDHATLDARRSARRRGAMERRIVLRAIAGCAARPSSRREVAPAAAPRFRCAWTPSAGAREAPRRVPCCARRRPCAGCRGCIAPRRAVLRARPDSAEVRRRMAARPGRRAARRARVLGAPPSTPRHAFVDAALVNQAYEDTSLPIGHGQTISKPSVVGRDDRTCCCRVRRPAPADRSAASLEIGSGCGYQAALLAAWASGRRRSSACALHDARASTCSSSARRACACCTATARSARPGGPYDNIIAAAGGEALPQAWIDQLAVGGRIVAPVQWVGARRGCLVVVDPQETGLVRGENEGAYFVPLEGGLVR